MFTSNDNSNLIKPTTHKVVLPFYIYAALSFLIAATMLLTSSHNLTQHYFQPQILAITHTMALGWGTMIILGACHQVLPVLIEGRLFSNALAYLTFAFAAAGVPLLVWAFHSFNMGWPAQSGALLINAAVLLYLINVVKSVTKSPHENIHAIFMLTAGVWLLITTLVGGLLVYNFSYNLLSKDSLHYLSLHAHLGIVGWFLLLVIGVGSRLIPMFLISKYSNPKVLWWIFVLINSGLITFILFFLNGARSLFYMVPVALIAFALILFGSYCREAYSKRIRKQVDGQMKVSLLSAALMVIPLVFLVVIIIVLLFSTVNTRLVLVYGFTVFFGWLTAIILGMTFKTLPFIVWNKVYHAKAGLGKTPNPKDLFNFRIFNYMALSYLGGFLCFSIGILSMNSLMIKGGAALLLCCAFLYNANVFRVLVHKEKIA
jgi:hypothetical protein